MFAMLMDWSKMELDFFTGLPLYMSGRFQNNFIVVNQRFAKLGCVYCCIVCNLLIFFSVCGTLTDLLFIFYKNSSEAPTGWQLLMESFAWWEIFHQIQKGVLSFRDIHCVFYCGILEKFSITVIMGRTNFMMMEVRGGMSWTLWTVHCISGSSCLVFYLLWGKGKNMLA